MVAIAFIILLWLGLSCPVAAHNGAGAVAVPVEGIAIDGDLSDWPAALKAYPITFVEYGTPPQSERDFQGVFRIGYNARENALYIAVGSTGRVQRNRHGRSRRVGTRRDGCEVYVDLVHGVGGGRPRRFAIGGNLLQKGSEGGGRGSPSRWTVPGDTGTSGGLDITTLSQASLQLVPGPHVGRRCGGGRQRRGRFPLPGWPGAVKSTRRCLST